MVNLTYKNRINTGLNTRSMQIIPPQDVIHQQPSRIPFKNHLLKWLLQPQIRYLTWTKDLRRLYVTDLNRHYCDNTSPAIRPVETQLSFLETSFCKEIELSVGQRTIYARYYAKDQVSVCSPACVVQFNFFKNNFTILEWSRHLTTIQMMCCDTTKCQHRL